MKPERLDETGHCILIDIDTIFDTRLGTLVFLYPDEIPTLIKDGYRQRRTDDLSELNPLIDMDKFKSIYDNRDKSIIALSRLSNMSFFLLYLIRELEKEVVTSVSTPMALTLVVNTHPYDLEPKELNSILLALQYRLGKIVDIKFTNRPPDSLNIVSLAYHGFTQYIMYDFNTWANIHYGTEEKSKNAKGRPDFIITVPKLFQSRSTIYEDEELVAILRNIAGDDIDESTFELATMTFAPQFSLMFLDPVFYSLIDLENPPEI